MKKKNVYLIVGIVSLICVIAGVSFAAWILNFQQTNNNIVATDCFSITFKEDTEAISLNKAYPITDEGKICLKEGIPEVSYYRFLAEMISDIKDKNLTFKGVLNAILNSPQRRKKLMVALKEELIQRSYLRVTKNKGIFGERECLVVDKDVELTTFLKEEDVLFVSLAYYARLNQEKKMVRDYFERVKDSAVAKRGKIVQNMVDSATVMAMAVLNTTMNT